MCVCCVCWWSLFTSSVSLHSLSTHCHYQFITTLFFFPCRSSTGEKGELSLHPFISHPFFSNPVVILSFFLYVLNLWTDSTLGNSLSSLSYNCWIGDLHWTTWELFNKDTRLLGDSSTKTPDYLGTLQQRHQTTWGLFKQDTRLLGESSTTDLLQTIFFYF